MYLANVCVVKFAHSIFLVLKDVPDDKNVKN